VISVGNLTRLKNFDMTIRAFAVLSQKVSSARLTIAGKGPLQPLLEQLAKDLGIGGKVEFVGQMPRNEVVTLMGRSDVFIFPSFEAAGMVVLEALAQGLPVVCMNYGGPGEMMTPACGFAVEVGPLAQTVERLGDALKTLAGDRQLCLRMSIAARQHVQENYLWENRHVPIRQWYASAGVEVAQPAKSKA
jgi:glycosyltransferase involved in cell wall biosynthesis